MKITRMPLGALQTNCYIVDNGERLLVIDPSAEPGAIIGKLKDIGLPVDGILLTHTHYDHFGALDEVQAFTGADVYMSDIETDWLTDISKNGSIRFTEEITSSVTPNTLKEGKAAVGAFNFDVIHTPGHSPGSLSYKFDDFVISGDVLFNKGVGRTDLYGGSTAELMHSIREKLYKLPPETTVYAGHNIPTTIGDEKENNPYVR
ncbi:putative metallo-hydrolase [Jeotgalicoccus saudimassiliensis]|uniref:Putative metallo-hydrolase n=1 Tax=Jeotgalicoccus saudimassiliensis TaxID=1461582 RepID=A0A078M1F2_9STAP|nr:MBL fold metallo-hydrolase [Jeotgalicoccus saudimassiliensis]CEA00045.1 putative metallo-hydrolase [Jeotgalicoccus saudimassiliensis]